MKSQVSFRVKIFDPIFACGKGGVPDLGERVPEDEGGVPPRLGHLNLPLARHVGLVCLVEGHLPGSKVGIRIETVYIAN